MNNSCAGSPCLNMTSPALKSRAGTPAPARSRKSTGGFAISALSAANVRAVGLSVRNLFAFAWIAVNRVDPQDRLWLLHRLDIEIDCDSFAVAAHQDTFQILIRTG